MFGRQKLHETELGSIRILILIHEKEEEATPIHRQQLSVRLKQFNRLHQQVIEVEGILG